MDWRKSLDKFPRSAIIGLSVAGLLATHVDHAQSQSSAQGKASAMFAYVGSFTTAKRKARGDGIHIYRADAGTGAWTHIQHIGDLTNPSYLALSPDLDFAFSRL